MIYGAAIAVEEKDGRFSGARRTEPAEQRCARARLERDLCDIHETNILWLDAFACWEVHELSLTQVEQRVNTEKRDQKQRQKNFGGPQHARSPQLRSR